jgi:uncharacterized protein (TIGR02996 family)
MTPLQAQLETDLVRAPDDLATHMAYGDYLAERGDPRGELVQVQLALEDPQHSSEHRASLRQREAELLDRHWGTFLGPFADFVSDPHALENRVTFRRGWIDSIRIGLFGSGLAHALAQTPGLQLLRSIRLLSIIPDRPAEGLDPREALAKLAPLAALPHLRSLSLGDHEGDAGLRPFGFPDVGDFLPRFRQLEELNLNILEAEEHLWNLSLPSLRVLRLDRFRLGQAGVAYLLAMPLFNTLHTLQIWNGRIPDASARGFARHLHTRSLRSLDLSFNWLSSAGIELLEGVCQNLRAEYQLTPETDVDYLAEQPEPFDGGWE